MPLLLQLMLEPHKVPHSLVRACNLDRPSNFSLHHHLIRLFLLVPEMNVVDLLVSVKLIIHASIRIIGVAMVALLVTQVVIQMAIQMAIQVAIPMVIKVGQLAVLLVILAVTPPLAMQVEVVLPQMATMMAMMIQALKVSFGTVLCPIHKVSISPQSRLIFAVFGGLHRSCPMLLYP